MLSEVIRNCDHDLPGGMVPVGIACVSSQLIPDDAVRHKGHTH